MQAFFDKDWEGAAEQFKEIKRKYGQSRYGRLAELRMADIAFEQDKLAEAVGAYKGFVQAHRNDPDISYAQYPRVQGAVHAGQRHAVAAAAGRARPGERARSLCGAATLPQGKPPEQAHHRDRLHARGGYRAERPPTSLYVARFYLNEDNFDAAVSRVQYALRNFDGSGLEPEAMVLLGETYLKMKKNKEAREAFNRVLAAYPESPFSMPAKEFLQHMNATGR